LLARAVKAKVFQDFMVSSIQLENERMKYGMFPNATEGPTLYSSFLRLQADAGDGDRRSRPVEAALPVTCAEAGQRGGKVAEEQDRRKYQSPIAEDEPHHY
jgi:hypothetical protein